MGGGVGGVWGDTCARDKGAIKDSWANQTCPNRDWLSVAQAARASFILDRDVKRSLEQVSCRADAEQEKATAFQEELSRSLEEVKGVEQEWRR